VTVSDPDRPKNVQHEWTAQRADNAFLSKALPPEAYFTAIDVGRSKNANDGQLRKLRGVKPGIPDWLIVWSGLTLWIERKVSASLSETQKITRDALVRNGHRWAFARSVEDIEAACLAAGIPLRATLGEIRGRIAEQNERLPAKRKRPARGFKADNSMSMAQYRRGHGKEYF
jgi:hypothetical protein